MDLVVVEMDLVVVELDLVVVELDLVVVEMDLVVVLIVHMMRDVEEDYSLVEVVV